MAILEGLTPPPRKVMTLFYLIDTSGSMSGSKIQQVNSAIEEVMAQLDDISRNNDDAEIKIAVLTFDNKVEWQTPRPMSPNDFNMGTLVANGLTYLGKACTELEAKLSRTEFLNTKAGAYPPIILLLSDGAPSDNFESGLSKLKSNNWFKRSIKIAFAIGHDADRDVFSRFTGSKEAVIDVNNAQVLKDMIMKVSVITSEFQSRSKDSNAETDETKVAEKLVENAKNEYIEEKSSGAAPDPFLKRIFSDPADEWEDKW